jgi:hypothetical protein
MHKIRQPGSPRPRVNCRRVAPPPYPTTSAGSSIFTDGRGSSGPLAAAGSNSRASSRLTWQRDNPAKHVKKLIRKLDLKPRLTVERLRGEGY